MNPSKEQLVQGLFQVMGVLVSRYPDAWEVIDQVMQAIESEQEVGCLPVGGSESRTPLLH